MVAVAHNDRATPLPFCLIFIIYHKSLKINKKTRNFITKIKKNVKNSNKRESTVLRRRFRVENYKREIIKFTKETDDKTILRQLYSFIYSYKKRKILKNSLNVEKSIGS